MNVMVAAGLVITIAGSASAQQSSFDGFVREALRSNLSLRQQSLTQERSEAAVRQARGLFLPGVTLDARYSEMQGGLDFGDLVNPAYQALNQVTGTNQFPTNIDGRFPYAQETRVRVAQPLFNASILANYRINKSLHGVQDARTKTLARQVAADVQLAYVNHARAAQVVDVYRASLELVNEHKRVSERLLANGKVTPDAVFRASAQVSEVEQQLADALQKRDASGRWFNFLLDRAADSPIELIADSLLPSEPPMPLTQLLERARRAREELTQADFGVRAANAQEQLARSSYLPSIALAVDYGIQGNRYRFDSRDDFAMASIVVSWNLFNGLQDAAKREQAAADASRGRVQRAELEKQVELQVLQTHDALQVAHRAQQTADARSYAAKRSFELVSRRYQEGVASTLELLDARTSYTAAQLNQVLTRHERAARYVELERAAALRDLDHDLTAGK